MIFKSLKESKADEELNAGERIVAIKQLSF
jgi:hypothetical protein